MSEKVKKCKLNRKVGFLYFIDKQGDVSCAAKAGGKKKESKS